MILSDKTIREELAAGRIVIEPFDETCIQPSSVDLHVDRYFRVFRNHTQRVIDVKDDQENLTELVEVLEDEPFILHPGEFVLGSTFEKVTIPDDIVGRIEGKSSMGRLGLLIHSSLPASERILIRTEAGLMLKPIGEVVGKKMQGAVAAFDPETFEAGYHKITGWYEGPPDRIFEVTLASGRSVRVTAGHNLFTLDRKGEITKVRTGELAAGEMVAVPRRLASASGSSEPTLDLLDLAPEDVYSRLVLSGPAVASAYHENPDLFRLLRESGRKHTDYYRAQGKIPYLVARLVPGVLETCAWGGFVGVRGGRDRLPTRIPVTKELAWWFGLYVAEGCRRRNQVTVSNTDQSILDRAVAVLDRLSIASYRTKKAVTACSGIFSELIDWLDMGQGAPRKQLPSVLFNWPAPLVDSFMEGYVDGDGSREATRISLWTSSPRLVDDFLYLMALLGRRASASFRRRSVHGLFQVSVPHREHKLLTSAPLPDRLLIAARERTGLTQLEASRRCGYRHASDLNNLERRRGRDAVRLATLRRIRSTYAESGLSGLEDERLGRLTDGSLAWDRVTQVRDTGVSETIYDLEVRPGGRRIENFLAGTGGVYVSNTAGFVDAGWDGHLTLELSNVANLPITIYPGMKIGQISFLRMTTPAEVPYGSKSVGSKYQGQRGPTPSRYFKNFEQ